jgi:hypothetical protein
LVSLAAAHPHRKSCVLHLNNSKCRQILVCEASNYGLNVLWKTCGIPGSLRKLCSDDKTEDAALFDGVTLEDVEKTAREVQTSQRKRRSLRNLNRITPLLEGLRKYGKTIEVLCNQTPYLAFVWVVHHSFRALKIHNG